MLLEQWNTWNRFFGIYIYYVQNGLQYIVVFTNFAHIRIYIKKGVPSVPLLLLLLLFGFIQVFFIGTFLGTFLEQKFYSCSIITTFLEHFSKSCSIVFHHFCSINSLKWKVVVINRSKFYLIRIFSNRNTNTSIFDIVNPCCLCWISIFVSYNITFLLPIT